MSDSDTRPGARWWGGFQGVAWEEGLVRSGDQGADGEGLSSATPVEFRMGITHALAAISQAMPNVVNVGRRVDKSDYRCEIIGDIMK